MFDLGQYLEKFKKLGESRDSIKHDVQDVILRICGIPIELTVIEVRGTTVRITGKPIVKNEIFLKKTQLLAALNEGREKKIIDIN